MKHISYNEHKKKYDAAVMSYIAKRIFTDIEDSSAFKAGLIDSVGNMKSENPVGWEFTNLDRFVLAIKQQIGEENLRELLDVYSDHSALNDFRLMRSMEKPLNQYEVDHLKKIVATMESLAYLPEGRDDSFIEDDEQADIDYRISTTLTLATFLLYAMKLGRIPTSIEFFSNIVPSVEVTFYHSANADYDYFKKYVIDSQLMTDKSLSSRTIRALVSVAGSMVDGGILSNDGSRVEDQTRMWEKLGSKRNGR